MTLVEIEAKFKINFEITVYKLHLLYRIIIFSKIKIIK